MFFRKLIVILSLLFIGVKGFSQVTRHIDSLHTFKQSKINIDVLGVSFQRESPIGSKNTLVLRTGLLYNFVFTSGNLTDKYSYSLHPIVIVGSRHYYRLYASSLELMKNIGNCVGLDIGIKTEPILSKNLESSPFIFLLPYWGIQRRVGKWGSFEFAIGPNVKYRLDTSKNNLNISPNLQIRLGYYL